MPLVILPDGSTIDFCKTMDHNSIIDGVPFGAWLTPANAEFYTQNGNLYQKPCRKLGNGKGFTPAEALALLNAMELLNRDPYYFAPAVREPLEGPYIAVLEMPEGGLNLSKLIVLCKLAESGGKAQQLIKQGAVKLNGQQIKDFKTPISAGEHELQIGKRVHWIIDVVERS